MNTLKITSKIKLFLAVGLMSTGIAAGVATSDPCPKSKWGIEARLINAKTPNNTANVTFTFVNPVFGTGVQHINIMYNKTKKQIDSDGKGIYKLAMKPGKYKFTISQFNCATLIGNLEIKNREQISVKVTFAAQDPKVKCG